MPGDLHYLSSEDDLYALPASFTVLARTKDEHRWDNDGHLQFSSYRHVLAEKPQSDFQSNSLRQQFAVNNLLKPKDR